MLKKTIEEGVYFAFRRAQAEALNQDRSHELHVTDTVSLLVLASSTFGVEETVCAEEETVDVLDDVLKGGGESTFVTDVFGFDWVDSSESV